MKIPDNKNYKNFIHYVHQQITIAKYSKNKYLKNIKLMIIMVMIKNMDNAKKNNN